jgi:hypothetical protein
MIGAQHTGPVLSPAPIYSLEKWWNLSKMGKPRVHIQGPSQKVAHGYTWGHSSGWESLP